MAIQRYSAELPPVPITFTLEMEPIAILIHISSRIEGLCKNSMEKHTSLYVGDTLLYLADQDQSIYNVLDIFREFRIFWRLCVNWRKYALYNLDKDSQSKHPYSQLEGRWI